MNAFDEIYKQLNASELKSSLEHC